VRKICGTYESAEEEVIEGSKLSEELVALATEVFKMPSYKMDHLKNPSKELQSLLWDDVTELTCVDGGYFMFNEHEWFDKVLKLGRIKRKMEVVVFKSAAGEKSRLLHRRYGMSTNFKSCNHYFIAWGTHVSKDKSFCEFTQANTTKGAFKLKSGLAHPHKVMLIPSDPWMTSGTLHLTLVNRVMTIIRQTVVLGGEPQDRDRLMELLNHYGRRNLHIDMGVQFNALHHHMSQHDLQLTGDALEDKMEQIGDKIRQTAYKQAFQKKDISEIPKVLYPDVLRAYFSGLFEIKDKNLDIALRMCTEKQAKGLGKFLAEDLLVTVDNLDKLLMLEGRAYDIFLIVHKRGFLKQLPYKIKGQLTFSNIVPALTGFVVGALCSHFGLGQAATDVTKELVSYAFTAAQAVSDYQSNKILAMNGNVQGLFKTDDIPQHAPNMEELFFQNNEATIDELVFELAVKHNYKVKIDKKKELPLWVTLLKDLIFAAIGIAVAVFGAPALPALAFIMPVVLKIADYAVCWLLHKVFDKEKKVPMLDNDEGPLFVAYLHFSFHEHNNFFTIGNAQSQEEMIELEKCVVQHIARERTQVALGNICARLVKQMKIFQYSNNIQNHLPLKTLPFDLIAKDFLQNAKDELVKVKERCYGYCVNNGQVSEDIGMVVGFLEKLSKTVLKQEHLPQIEQAYKDIIKLSAVESKMIKPLKKSYLDGKYVQTDFWDFDKDVATKSQYTLGLVHRGLPGDAGFADSTTDSIMLSSLMAARLRQSGIRIVTTANVDDLTVYLADLGIVTLSDWMQLPIDTVRSLAVPIGLRNRFIREGCQYSAAYASVWEGVEL